jgi:hypothetical protein
MFFMLGLSHSAELFCGGRDISPMSAVPPTNAGIAVPLPCPWMLIGDVIFEAPQLGFAAFKLFQ